MNNQQAARELKGIMELTESASKSLNDVVTLISTFLTTFEGTPHPQPTRPQRNTQRSTKEVVLAKAGPVKESKGKSPLTPYFLFLQKNRQQVHEAHPDLTPKEIAHVMGQIWNSMTQQEKQVYTAEYRRNKTQYQRNDFV